MLFLLQCTTAEFLKLKSKDVPTELSEDLSAAEDIDTRDGKEESEVVGGAIHLCLNDSPLCFINTYVGRRTAEKLKYDSYYLHLKSNMDLDMSFRHAFHIGRPLEEMLVGPVCSKYFIRWNNVFKGSARPETVTYHALTSNSSSELACDTTVSDGYYDVSFIYNLLPISPEQRGILRSKILINLSSLRCS